MIHLCIWLLALPCQEHLGKLTFIEYILLALFSILKILNNFVNSFNVSLGIETFNQTKNIVIFLKFAFLEAPAETI